MKIKSWIFFVFLILILPIPVSAANWFIDNAALGNNDGTSWGNAWNSFSEISWTSISPGDTLFISGGVDNKIYRIRETGSLSVGANGTPESFLLIRPGGASPAPSGHDGTVIIDGEGQYNGLISMAGRSYVAIDGQVLGEKKILVRNSQINCDGSPGSIIEAAGSSRVKISYVEIKSGEMGINLTHAEKFEIHHCIIHDIRQEAIIRATGNFEADGQYGGSSIHHNELRGNVNKDGQGQGTDGIQATFSIDIYDNILGGNLVEPALHCGINSQHPDGMALAGRYFRIYNNHIFDWPNAFLTADLADNNEGHLWVYNNIFEITKTPSSGFWDGAGRVIDYAAKTSGMILKDIIFAHNTIVNTTIYGLHINLYYSNISFSDVLIKNNLWYNSAGPNSLVYLEDDGIYTCGSISGDVQIDYNLNNAGDQGGEGFTCDGKVFFQEHDINDAPEFVIYRGFSPFNDYHLASQPAETGVDLSKYFRTDFDGNIRTRWDFGAFEYVIGRESIAPNFPETLQIR